MVDNGDSAATAAISSEAMYPILTPETQTEMASGSAWLEGLEKNTLQQRNIDGSIQSGARIELQSGAKKEEGWQDRHAERFYEEVRNRKPYSDANLIAKNIDGFSIEQLEEIRQHVFIREHPRSGGMYRFIPDYDQAEVWQRLTLNDNIRKSDITFLNHELLELTIMKETGCSYEEAHAKANTVYNWWDDFVKGD